MGEVLIVLLPVALAVLLLSAGIEDVRRREIANWKNAAIALLAVPWWFALGLDPWPGMAIQIGIAAAAFALFAGAFALGMMGGGDVKLIGALALWLPFPALAWMLVVMSLLGGAVTLLLWLEHRWRRREGRLEIPYGVAIVGAALLSFHEPLLNHFG